MIDLHCHILSGVDDGASSDEESCLMAQMALDNGVTTVVMTPHCNVPGYFTNYADAALAERFTHMEQLLRQRNIPLQLYRGMEVYVTRELPELLQQNRLLTLGNSRYLLVEFGFDEPAGFMTDMLHVVMDHGLIPVVAHPERYYCAQDDHHLPMPGPTSRTMTPPKLPSFCCRKTPGAY